MLSIQINHALRNADEQPGVACDGSFRKLPPGLKQRGTGRAEPFDITLLDGRKPDAPMSVSINGVDFAANFEPAVDVQTNGLDSDAIVERHYPRMAAFAGGAPGEDRVTQAIVFGHTIRSIATNGENVGGYGSSAHKDNSSYSAKIRVKRLSRPGATWRQLYPGGPAAERGRSRTYRERTFRHLHPHQRWLFCDHRRHHEALPFMVFDDAAELGLASCPPHASFALPNIDDDTPPREFIECRIVVECNPQ